MPNASFSEDFNPLGQTLEDIFQVVGHNINESQKMRTEVDKFILQLTFADLITKAPQNIHDKLITESKKEPSREKTIKLFKDNFTPDDVKNSYQLATYTIMQKYFEEVSPTLDDVQKQRIANIIQKQYSDLNRK